MDRICMLMPYFGNWLPWMDFFLETCRHNATVNWIFFTDCEPPKKQFDNVEFIVMTTKQFNSFVKKQTGISINVNNKAKLCDLRPAYGDIFRDYLKDYEFWGFGDIDVLYGNIRNFITEQMTKHYDVISARRLHVAGHFTIFRNIPKLNLMYRNIPGFQELCSWPWHLVLDESMFSHRLRNMAHKEQITFFHKNLLEHDQKRNPGNEKWCLDWNKGKLIVKKDNEKEIMYFHFMRSKNDKRFVLPTYKNNIHQYHIEGKFYQPKPQTLRTNIRSWIIQKIRRASKSWKTLDQKVLSTKTSKTEKFLLTTNYKAWKTITVQLIKLDLFKFLWRVRK